MGNTPTPQTATAPANSVDKITQLMQVLGPIMQRMGGQLGQGGTQSQGPVVSPGRTGGAPPQLALPAGAQRPSMPYSGSDQVQAVGRPPTPMPQGAATGFEFSTKGGKRGATAYNLLSNLTETINKFTQRESDLRKKEAEYYAKEVFDAWNRGDMDAANAILADPKVQKIMKKFLGYVPFKKTQEPPPPEHAGVVSAAQKSITQGGSLQVKPGQAEALGSQVGALQQQLLNKPQEAYRAMTGTTMSPEMQQQAEKIQSQLSVSPVMLAQMDSATQSLVFKTAADMSMFESQMDHQYQMEMDKAKALGKTDVEVAKIRAASLREHYGILKDYYSSKGAAQAAMLTRDLLKAYQGYGKMYSDQARSYAALAQKSTDTDEKNQWLAQEEAAKKAQGEWEDRVSELELQNLLQDTQTKGAAAGAAPME